MPESTPESARQWVSTLAKYRDPNTGRSLFELAVSVLPFITLATLAWLSLSVSYGLALVLSLFNGAFLVRMFIIQHDCGHGSFFSSRKANNWVGRSIGMFTLTPYKVWKRSHSIHHSAAGNLDRRGIGDVYTLTVKEYAALPWLKRAAYRVYRHPVFLFGFAPALLFMVQNRVPLGMLRSWEYWMSAMGTNAMIAVMLGAMVWFGGLAPIFIIFLPTLLVAATIGVWLFYVQHQFENAQWDHDEDWQLHEAALMGSSYYVLPGILRWFSGNIGVHHVHHLYSRIPFYRLMEVVRENAALENLNRMTIRESLKSAQMHLWDEGTRKLVSFRQARQLA
jgi:omega-6 fatty acid desaturase (delta-12 desaturase)